jgi:choline dehydrogenase-like flavoprotein
MIIEGSRLQTPFSLRVDAVVVGSGSGGAIVARELARFGHDVAVIEEGRHVRPEQYRAFSPIEAFRILLREAGLGVAVSLRPSPVMSVLAAKCVGGSSVVTGGVCFQIPGEVLGQWQAQGLADLTEARLTPLASELEADLSVETVPERMRSRSTERFVEGAARMGISMKSVRRNTQGCEGRSLCNFGCDKKKSVDVAVLPEAIERGATILCEARVETVIIERGTAVGVRGHFASREPGAPRIPFEVRANTVIIACGSLHTPKLLHHSGLRSKHIGNNLTLHPSFRVGALFDEAIMGWNGAMQSTYSDHFKDEGITLIGAYTAPNIIAASLPGSGREHRAYMERLPHMAFFGAMVHDEAQGYMGSPGAREPLAHYTLGKRDTHRMWRAIEILGRMAFAAGAREVFLPILGGPGLRTESELDALLHHRPSVRRIESMSFHPLGTARMSAEASHGVVKPSGETWEVKNLYVADGSVLPTSLGVNSQLPIMTMAMHIARRLAESMQVGAATQTPKAA